MFDSEKDQEILKKALNMYTDEIIDSLPPESEIDKVTFSPEFERKMQKLIRAQKRPGWRFVNTAAKKAAVIIVAAVLSLGTVMAVPAVRDPIVNVIFKNYSDHADYMADESALQANSALIPESIETVYLPKYIPDGYKQMMNNKSDASVLVAWQNENDDMIVYQQDVVTAGYNIDTENAKVSEVDIRENKAHKIVKNGTVSYYWTENGYVFSLILPEKLDKQAKNITDSIKNDSQ